MCWLVLLHAPIRSGWRLADDLPLKRFLKEAVIPYEADEAEVSRLILDNHDPSAFASISHLTVGDFRNWLLSDECTGEELTRKRNRRKFF